VDNEDDDDSVLIVEIPCGRSKRPLQFYSQERLEGFLAIPFHKYVYVPGFEAVFNKEDGTIEVGLQALTPISWRFHLLPMLTQREGAAKEDDFKLEVQSSDASRAIELSPPSREFLAFVRLPPHTKATLKLSGIARHEDYVATLRRVADSFLFQLDVSRGVALGLMQERSRLRKLFKRPSSRGKLDLEFPKHGYDSAPMELYWYARSADQLPLLQFLAFYQVLEYYFHAYSQEDAKRRITQILKDPSFRHDSDAAIGRLLRVASGAGRGYGDERSQLRATIQQCVAADDLSAFLNATDERKAFFSDKTSELTNKNIPLKDREKTDFRADIADRIYDIRCRIVHTKSSVSDGQVDLLLPFSEEARLLTHDNELMQFLAKLVLIAASTSL
jgi:hypothetical protein